MTDGSVVPVVAVQLTPHLRVFINGCDRTAKVVGVAAVALARLGEGIGWARRQFEFGVAKAEGGDIPDLTPVCDSIWRDESGGPTLHCKLRAGHDAAEAHTDGDTMWVKP